MPIAGNAPAASAAVPLRVRPVLAPATAAQAGGCAVALVLALALPEAMAVPIGAIAVLQCVAAALIAVVLGQPRWWIAIHLAFVPLAVLAGSLQIDSRWYLGAFTLLVLVYGGVHRSRVPLFLSSERAVRSLVGEIPRGVPLRFLDLGCGTGGVLARVARERPLVECHGVEAATLPALVAKLRPDGRFTVRRASLWTEDLSAYDIVYAYLSPAAMGALEAKVLSQMKPGAMLISNGFPLPAAAPDAMLRWGAGAAERLFIYRIR